VSEEAGAHAGTGQVAEAPLPSEFLPPPFWCRPGAAAALRDVVPLLVEGCLAGFTLSPFSALHCLGLSADTLAAAWEPVQWAPDPGPCLQAALWTRHANAVLCRGLRDMCHVKTVHDMYVSPPHPTHSHTSRTPHAQQLTHTFR
jgi:hypothetical protein